MKTKKDFLNNYSNNPELAKLALKAGGVDWADLEQYPNDYCYASNGSVNGMIYYEDTVKFAKKNHLLILQSLDEYEDECGKITNKPKATDETQYFNWLAWFAWECTIGDVINYLED